MENKLQFGFVLPIKTLFWNFLKLKYPYFGASCFPILEQNILHVISNSQVERDISGGEVNLEKQVSLENLKSCGKNNKFPKRGYLHG